MTFEFWWRNYDEEGESSESIARAAFEAGQRPGDASLPAALERIASMNGRGSDGRTHHDDCEHADCVARRAIAGYPARSGLLERAANLLEVAFGPPSWRADARTWLADYRRMVSK